MSEFKILRSSTQDGLFHWLELEHKGKSTEIMKLAFNDLPFIDQVFIEKIGNALMEEIREQHISWREGESYDRKPSYFDRKKSERTAIKIIEDMKRGSNGL